MPHSNFVITPKPAGLFNRPTFDRLSYADALLAKEAIEAEVSAASNALKLWDGCKRANGLLPDSVKASPLYRQQKERYARAFRKLQDFNAWFVKKHGAVYRATHR